MDGVTRLPGAAASKALPLVVSYGAGVDSTAMLVGFAERGVRPDVILFADTGSEKPKTYSFLPVVDDYLASIGFPRLTIVRNKCPRAKHASIEENCFKNETLPAQAFRGGQPGGGNCSSRWKHEPMDRWLYRQKIRERVRAVGYDAGPRDSKRACNGSPESKKHKRDHFVYPLQAWGWDREACMAAIRRAGLDVPVKSSCFLCPAMKKDEIRDLADHHPDLLRRAIAIEDRAREGKHGLKSIQGLGRSFSWGSLSQCEKLLEEHGREVPAEPIAIDERAQAWLRERTILV